jgi:hypothetical protein
MKKKNMIFWFLLITVAVFLQTAKTAFAQDLSGLVFKPKLKIVSGSGEFMKIVDTVSLISPQDLTFQWSTMSAKTPIKAEWQVTVKNKFTKPILVTKGSVPPKDIPLVGHWGSFTIPANAFLKSTPPASPITYYVTITFINGRRFVDSLPVMITQMPQDSGPTFSDTATFVYPSIQLLRYEEQAGANPPHATAVLKVRVINNGILPTSKVSISVYDYNALMKQSTGATVDVLQHQGDYHDLAIPMQAALVPSSEQPSDWATSQYIDWQAAYKNPGIDLYASVYWNGSDPERPLTDHFHVALYKGSGDSCHNGKKDGDETGTDSGGQCNP